MWGCQPGRADSWGKKILTTEGTESAEETQFLRSDSLPSGARDNAATVAEADAGQALFFAEAAQCDFIAIFEEGTNFAVGQVKWRLAALGDFEETALRAGLRAGDCSAGQKITSEQIAAVAGVVGDHLAECPIEALRIAAG